MAAPGLTVLERASRVVPDELGIDILGPCTYAPPLAKRLAKQSIHYAGKADRVLLDDRLSRVTEHRADLASASSTCRCRSPRASASRST